jgi:hypothetical protein
MIGRSRALPLAPLPITAATPNIPFSNNTMIPNTDAWHLTSDVFPVCQRSLVNAGSSSVNLRTAHRGIGEQRPASVPLPPSAATLARTYLPLTPAGVAEPTIIDAHHGGVRPARVSRPAKTLPLPPPPPQIEGYYYKPTRCSVSS